MKYTAITIGPIIDTLNSARKTRELWGASYLFSFIIRKTVEELKNNNINILLPFYINDSEWNNNLGAGLFPDRIFVEGEIDIQKNYFEPVRNKIADQIFNWLDSKKLKRSIILDEIKKYLENYIRFIQVQFECQGDENIIEIGTTLLDSKELQTKINPENNFVEKENPLFFFLYHVNGSFLFRDGFKNTRKRFPSLIEIASSEFEYTQDYQIIKSNIEKFLTQSEDLNTEKSEGKDEEEEIIELLKNTFGKEFRQVHKYVAIVQADGDKIGQMVTKVGTKPVEIQNFSQKLMEFSRKATDIVVNYGGSPVYMGGDDLFFFAPLVYVKENSRTHILEIVKELNIKFEDIVKSYAKNTLHISDSDLPSLSFGISLSYYKFPLYEARNLAFDALFEEIKWADKRNAINLKFRKHSGQIMELFVNKKQSVLWDNTIRFISENLDTKADFLNSFTQKLRLQEDVLFEKIVKDNNKLTFFFKNNFNENYNQYKKFYENLANFIQVLDKNSTGIKPKEYLYSVLRFIHFLRS